MVGLGSVSSQLHAVRWHLSYYNTFPEHKEEAITQEVVLQVKRVCASQTKRQGPTVTSWGLMYLASASRIDSRISRGTEPAYLCMCIYVCVSVDNPGNLC